MLEQARIEEREKAQDDNEDDSDKEDSSDDPEHRPGPTGFTDSDSETELDPLAAKQRRRQQLQKLVARRKK